MEEKFKIMTNIVAVLIMKFVKITVSQHQREKVTEKNANLDVPFGLKIRCDRKDVMVNYDLCFVSNNDFYYS